MKITGIHKPLFIVLGILSLGLGLVGIAVPVLPTTPFILLAAALFVRSSRRLHDALFSSRLLGKYLRDFHERGGMTLKAKLYALILMWIMIGVSLYLLNSTPWRITLAVLALIGTVVMGWVVPTVKI